MQIIQMARVGTGHGLQLGLAHNKGERWKASDDLEPSDASWVISYKLVISKSPDS